PRVSAVGARRSAARPRPAPKPSRPHAARRPEAMREIVPDRVWVEEHSLSLAGARFLTRMTVLRLNDGLCLHSPVEIDEETRSAIAALGEVRAIVAPSTFHHLFVASAQKAFPDART